MNLSEVIKVVRGSGISIIWIEHVVHVLLAVVDRLLVINFGKHLARGRAARGDGQRRGPGSLYGNRSRMSLLQTEELAAGYGDFQALVWRQFRDRPRAKSSPSSAPTAPARPRCCKTICGLLRPRRRPTSRSTAIAIGALEPGTIVALGIAMVPEGRRAFASLNVDDNLRMGGYCGRTGPWTLDRVYALFPQSGGDDVLRCRRRSPAGSSKCWRSVAR